MPHVKQLDWDTLNTRITVNFGSKEMRVRKIHSEGPVHSAKYNIAVPS